MKRTHTVLIFALLIIFLSPYILSFSIGGAAQFNQEIYQAQKALKELGYNPGKPDGIRGKATEKAIKYFQVDTGLQVTGQLDDQTKEFLEKLAQFYPKKGVRNLWD